MLLIATDCYLLIATDCLIRGDDARANLFRPPHQGGDSAFRPGADDGNLTRLVFIVLIPYLTVASIGNQQSSEMVISGRGDADERGNAGEGGDGPTLHHTLSPTANRSASTFLLKLSGVARQDSKPAFRIAASRLLPINTSLLTLASHGMPHSSVKSPLKIICTAW